MSLLTGRKLQHLSENNFFLIRQQTNKKNPSEMRPWTNDDPQGSTYPIVQWPWSSKTSSWACGFEQSFIQNFIYCEVVPVISRSRNCIIWEVRQVKICGNIEPCPHASIVLRECINSYPPGQNGCHFTDDIFKCIFVNGKFCILIKISLKCVPKGPIDNNPALV